VVSSRTSAQEITCSPESQVEFEAIVQKSIASGASKLNLVRNARTQATCDWVLRVALVVCRRGQTRGVSRGDSRFKDLYFRQRERHHLLALL